METIKEIRTYYEDELKNILDSHKVKEVRDISSVHDRTRAEDYSNFIYHLENLNKKYYIQVKVEYWESQFIEKGITEKVAKQNFINDEMKRLQKAVEDNTIQTIIASNDSFRLVEIYQKDIPVQLTKESLSYNNLTP